MRGRHQRYSCASGVAPMRAIVFFLLVAASITANASTVIFWTVGSSGVRYATSAAAITGQAPQLISPFVFKLSGSPPLETFQIYANPSPTNVYQPAGLAYKGTIDCPFGNTGLVCNTSCPAPKVMSGGQCITPVPVDPCASKAGTSSTFQKTYSSYAAYSPIYETTSQGGCGMTVGAMECGSSATGEFSCWGTGTYTGTSLAEQEGGGVQDCTENCTPPDPKATTNDQQCTANGSGGFTCTTSSSSSEFAASECTVGSVGGSTGYVCVQPDYVPESAAATKTDNTTVTQNPDGTTTTTVTSSTDNTYCSGGGCTTTTTTTTGSTTTDAAGNVLGKTEDCTGPNCAGPTDETKEEEPEEFTAPSAYTAPDASAAMPVLEEVPTYAETLASFKNRLGNAPLVAGLSNIAVPSGGSCDIGSASLFGGSISFNHFCEIAPSILSGLTYLFLSIWAWAAIRLFFTA
jgi:hypothetical protein